MPNWSTDTPGVYWMASVTVCTLRASISLRVTTLTDCGFSRMDVSVFVPVALREATSPGAGPQAFSATPAPVTVTVSNVAASSPAGRTTMAPLSSLAVSRLPASKAWTACITVMRPDTAPALRPATTLASTRMGVPPWRASVFSDWDSAPAGRSTSTAAAWAAAATLAAPIEAAKRLRIRKRRVARGGARRVVPVMRVLRVLRSIMVNPREGSDHENERAAIYRTIIFGRRERCARRPRPTFRP